MQISILYKENTYVLFCGYEISHPKRKACSLSPSHPHMLRISKKTGVKVTVIVCVCVIGLSFIAAVWPLEAVACLFVYPQTMLKLTASLVKALL